ncbi:uncharacterized protein LOC110432650 [Sorghum bicolor]|uniref:uncharacterized protein LOC110432650 n=1 Tax=Sorghum bicolor TaxID=4558 RepID=UPI000B425F61|nr:uncharacterized protein LOC110432650 [Sorghum bicolor]|eukprot:XP_021309101.1 uncharacterized protein LOC110432650 [Sorghum bicolor]
MLSLCLATAGVAAATLRHRLGPVRRDDARTRDHDDHRRVAPATSTPCTPVAVPHRDVLVSTIPAATSATPCCQCHQAPPLRLQRQAAPPPSPLVDVVLASSSPRPCCVEPRAAAAPRPQREADYAKPERPSRHVDSAMAGNARSPPRQAPLSANCDVARALSHVLAAVTTPAAARQPRHRCGDQAPRPRPASMAPSSPCSDPAASTPPGAPSNHSTTATPGHRDGHRVSAGHGDRDPEHDVEPRRVPVLATVTASSSCPCLRQAKPSVSHQEPSFYPAPHSITFRLRPTFVP